MDYAIKILEKERENIVADLKKQNNRISDLQQIDKAIGWLKLLQNKKVNNANSYNFYELPYIEGRGGFTYYRIMIDNETDDTNYWDEYKKQNGEHFLLSLGDFILEHK